MFGFHIDNDLELFLWEMQHADELFALVMENREYARRWLPWVDATKSADDTRDFIKRSLARFAENNGWSAGIRERGSLVGGFGLHYINWTHRRTEIGYWLAENAQGRGVMTRTVLAMCNHCFGELKLNRVEIHCATGNQRSRGIPERLGFINEGTLREVVTCNGAYEDHVVYAMLAREWPQPLT